MIKVTEIYYESEIIYRERTVYVNPDDISFMVESHGISPDKERDYHCKIFMRGGAIICGKEDIDEVYKMIKKDVSYKRNNVVYVR